MDLGVTYITYAGSGKDARRLPVSGADDEDDGGRLYYTADASWQMATWAVTSWPTFDFRSTSHVTRRPATGSLDRRRYHLHGLAGWSVSPSIGGHFSVTVPLVDACSVTIIVLWRYGGCRCFARNVKLWGELWCATETGEDLKGKVHTLNIRQNCIRVKTDRVGQKTGPLRYIASNFRNTAQIYAIFLQKSKSFHS